MQNTNFMLIIGFDETEKNIRLKKVALSLNRAIEIAKEQGDLDENDDFGHNIAYADLRYKGEVIDEYNVLQYSAI